MARKKRDFASVLAGYKTYDDSNGRGSEREWRQAFAHRMGFEEAEQFFADEARAGRKATPYEVLGVTFGDAWGVIKSAYRRLCRMHATDTYQGELQAGRDAAGLPHYTADELVPLLAGRTETLKGINAAYVIVEREYERAGRKI